MDKSMNKSVLIMALRNIRMVLLNILERIADLVTHSRRKEISKRLNIFNNFAVNNGFSFTPSVNLGKETTAESLLIQEAALKLGLKTENKNIEKLSHKIIQSELPNFWKNFSEVNYILHTVKNEVDIYIFEHHRYDQVEATSDTRETIVCFISVKLDLPWFLLEPRNLFHNIMRIPGVYQTMKLEEVKFENAPKFTEHYYLVTKEKQKILGVFTPGLIRLLDGYKNVSLAGNKDTLICYQNNTIVDLTNITHFLEEVNLLYDMMVSK